MSDETTTPEAGETDLTDATDVADNSLVTDFTQVVSCAVGMDRIERRRQKIRRELVRQYFAGEEQAPASVLARFKKMFGTG